MFVAYEVAMDVCRDLAPLIETVKRRDRNLADQIQRAASSIVLNLAEGQRMGNGNRGRHYEIAHGSAAEVRAGIALAEVWGYGVREPQNFDRLMRLLWGLTKSRLVASASGPKANP